MPGERSRVREKQEEEELEDREQRGNCLIQTIAKHSLHGLPSRSPGFLSTAKLYVTSIALLITQHCQSIHTKR